MPVNIEPVPDKDGLAIDFQLEPGGTHAVMSSGAFDWVVNGVPFHDCEQRVAIVIQRLPGTPEPRSASQPLKKLSAPVNTSQKAFNADLDPTRLILEVNRAGACVETGSNLSDQQYKACKVTSNATTAPTPTPDPSSNTNPAPSPAASVAASGETATPSTDAPPVPSAGSDAPVAGTTAPPVSSSPPGPTATPSATPLPTPTTLEGKVIAPWAALNEIFTRPCTARAAGGRRELEKRRR